MRKVALEENFVSDALASYGASTAGIAQPSVEGGVAEPVGPYRLARLEEMDVARTIVQSNAEPDQLLPSSSQVQTLV